MLEIIDINWCPSYANVNLHRKQFFVNGVVKLWNMLPDEMVSVSSASSFKRFERHLDGFWYDRDLYYNYETDM